MLGNLLLYPFVLVARRPAHALGILFGSLLVLLAVDVAFAELGYDALASDFRSSEGRLYYIVTSLIGGFVTALPMSLALYDLQLRLQPPSLRDGVALLALNIWFGVAVMIPFVLGAVASIGVVGALVPEPYRMAVGIVGGVAWAVALIVVCVRLALAGPRTLVDERVQLYRTWGLTRGKFWIVLGASLAAVAVTAILFLALAVTPVLLVPYPDPIESWQDAFRPAAFVGLLSSELAFVLAIAYLSAAQSFLFNHILPAD